MRLQVADEPIDVNVKRRLSGECDIFASRQIVMDLAVAVKYTHINHIGYNYYIFTFLSI
jgi:hypothetical protein